jgi:CIC family chloride channel protein
MRPGIGGHVTGICAVAGLWLVGSEGDAGGGYEQLASSLNGSLPIVTLLVLGGLKFVATLFSYASGGAGGLFAPALFIGAMIGSGVGWLDDLVFHHADVGGFALVGMGAAFAGIIRAPITSVLIIFEMTGGYGLVLPLMIANTFSYVVARKLDSRGLYDSLLEQDGIHLLHRPAVEARLHGLLVQDAMTAEVHSLPGELSATDALSDIMRDGFGVYPVIDSERTCLGVITRARVQRINAEGKGETHVREYVRLKEYVFPDDPLLHAVVRMNALGTRQLPVISRNGGRLEGLIAMSDVFRAQAEAADAAAESSPFGR